MVDIYEQVKTYIVAFLVAFLGTGTGWAVIKLVANSMFSGAKKLIAKLEEDGKINEEKVKLFQAQAKKYEDKCNELLNKQEELITYIEQYIEVDKEKEKKATELLNELFTNVEIPQLEENKGVEENEETKAD